MELSVVLLPDLAPAELAARAREAEAAGARGVWTYDHLSWRTGGPWHAAVPLLAALCVQTSTVRLGPLVASPNVRHPVPFAQEVTTLDHLSGGRIDLGVGAGTLTGPDAAALRAPLDRRRAADRFGSFVALLDRLLTSDTTTSTDEWYEAHDVPVRPQTVQQPRVPFTIAATGTRGMALVAEHGQGWVSYGPTGPVETAQGWYDALAEQVERLESACAAAGRDPATVRRTALVSLDLGWALASVGAYDDLVGRLGGLGFDEVAVHGPRLDPRLPGPPPAVYQQVLARL